MPFNNLNNIISTLDKLLDGDSKKLLSNAKRDEGSFILNDVEGIFKSVETVFSFRHEICHTSGTRIEIRNSDIKVLANDLCHFAEALVVLRNKETRKEAISQRTMNDIAHSELRNAIKGLEELHKEVLDSVTNDQVNSYNEVISLWNKYKEKWGDFLAEKYQGGTIYPLVRSNVEHEMVRLKSKQIKNYLAEG